MAAIDFPTATSNGQTFEADSGVIYTYVGTPPNGFWSGTFGTTGLTTLDGRYIAKNDSNTIQTIQTQGLKFNSGSADTILIDGLNSKIGIGTTSVSNKLVISDGSNNNVEFSPGSTNTLLSYDRGGAAYLPIRIRASSHSFANGTTDFATIDSSGRVGIGLTPHAGSGYALQVDGGASSFLQFFNDTTGETINDGLVIGNDSATAYIVNKEATPLTFRTSNTERMRIDSSGNVGIGTTNPLVPFVLSDDGNKNIEMGYSSGTSSHYVQAYNRSTSAYAQLDLAGSVLTFKTPTESMRIDSSGNVGIGGSPSSFSTQKSLSLFAGSSTVARLDFYNSDGSTREAEIISYSSNNEALRLGGLTNRNLTFHTNSTERMRIEDAGNVGIGTTNASCRLHVRSDGNSYPLLVQNRTNAVSTAGIAFIASGSDLHDGQYASIEALSGGAGTTSHELLFRTCLSGGTPTEKIRIDTAGRLLVNRSATASNGALAQFSSSVGPHISVNNTGTAGTFMLFQNSATGDSTSDGLYVGMDSSKGYFWNYESAGLVFGNNGAAVGQFIGTKLNVPGVYSGTTTGGGPVYVESDGDLLRYTSSLKYKTDVETLEDARADAILNCRPVWYRSKCENDIKTEGAEKSDWGWYGFIAEEVAEIEPRLVNWATKDSVEQEDKTTLSVERDPADYEAEGVRYDNFVPLMLNLIKRQKAQIEILLTTTAELSSEKPINIRQTTSLLNNPFITFLNSSGDTAGSIIQNGVNSVTYATSSDYRLKDNVVELTAAIPRLKQLAPKRFNFIAAADVTVDGFLAHEAQAVVPEAVTGSHNQVDGDGNPVMQGIDQSKLVPLLTAALQEAIGRIETLEAKVATLEGS